MSRQGYCIACNAVVDYPFSNPTWEGHVFKIHPECGALIPKDRVPYSKECSICFKKIYLLTRNASINPHILKYHPKTAEKMALFGGTEKIARGVYCPYCRVDFLLTSAHSNMMTFCDHFVNCQKAHLVRKEARNQAKRDKNSASNSNV
jgi:hypothetical protein